jgi:Mitochondrial carrier protein
MAYEEMLKIVRNFSVAEPSSIHFVCAGLLSKTFAVVTTYPYQIVRSRLQLRLSLAEADKHLKLGHIIQSIW